MCMDKVGVNVNVNQTQVARALDQLPEQPANCHFLKQWLVKELIGIDRQVEEKGEGGGQVAEARR